MACFGWYRNEIAKWVEGVKAVILFREIQEGKIRLKVIIVSNKIKKIDDKLIFWFGVIAAK